MLRKVIKVLVKPVLEEVLQERANQVQAVTQALIDGNSRGCKHARVGQWAEKHRYEWTRHNKVSGEIIQMERICKDCGEVEVKKITVDLLEGIK